MLRKLTRNIETYKNDLKEKGLIFSVLDRLLRNKTFKSLYNSLKPESVTVDGMTVFIDTEDTVVSEYLLRNKHWEEFEISLFRKCLRAGDTVADVGAHIGMYTLAAAQVVGSKGKVLAFEPSPRNFALLSRNISFNNLHAVTVFNQAVSDKLGTVSLHLEAENTGDNRIYGSPQARKVVTVTATTLDSVFTESSLNISVVKMDIQGAELQALKGATQLLKHNGDLIIFTEFWPVGLKLAGAKPRDFLKLLSDAGFKFYEPDELHQKVRPLSITQILKKYHQDDQISLNLICARSGNKRLQPLLS